MASILKRLRGRLKRRYQIRVVLTGIGRGILFFLLFTFLMFLLVFFMEQVFAPGLEVVEWSHVAVDESGKPSAGYTTAGGPGLPIRVDGNPRVVFVEGNVRVSKAEHYLADVYVDDYLTSVRVNGVEVFVENVSGSCKHCAGVTVDLGHHLVPGENKVLFKVVNTGGPMKFYIKWMTEDTGKPTRAYVSAAVLGAAILALLYRLGFIGRRELEYLPLTLVLLAAAYIMLPRVDTYVYSEGHTRFNFFMYDSAARNFIEHGFIESRFGMKTGHITGYYVSHPPLLSILTALSYKMLLPLGWVDKAAATIIPTLFSLASVAMLYMIGKTLWGDAVAFFSAAVMVMTPMFGRWSQLLNFEPPTMFFILSALYSYILWMRTGRNRYFHIMCAVTFVGCFMDWPAYFLIPLIVVHHTLLGRRRDVRRMLLLVVIGTLCFLVFLTHVYILKGVEGMGDLINTFEHRNSYRGDDAFKKSEGPLWRVHEFMKSVDKVRGYNTPYVFYLSLVFFARIIYSIFRGRSVYRETFVLILVLIGVINSLLGPGGVAHHDYWLYYFTPALSLAAAAAAYQVVCSLKNRFTHSFLPKTA